MPVELKAIEDGIRQYFTKGDFGNNYASHRAAQASFALSIADSAMDETAKRQAYQAIAIAIKTGSTRNTNWFLGAQGWFRKGGSRLYRALTQSGGVSLELQPEIPEQYKATIAALTKEYPNNQHPTYLALFDMLANILKSGMDRVQTAKVIDLWIKTVNIFSVSNLGNSEHRFEGEFATKIRKAPENVMRLSDKSVVKIVDTLLPHAESYNAQREEIKKIKLAAMAKIDPIRKKINKLFNYFGVKDRFLECLSAIKGELDVLQSEGNLTDALIKVKNLADKVDDVQRAALAAQACHDAVDKVKARVAELRKNIEELFKQEPDSSYRQEKLKSLLPRLDDILSITLQSVFNDKAKGIEFNLDEEFAPINTALRVIDGKCMELEKETFQISEYDILGRKLAMQIGMLTSELKDETGWFAKSPDLDGIKKTLQATLFELQEHLRLLGSADKNACPGIENFDQALSKLKDMAAQLTLIEGGVAIQQRICGILDEFPKIELSVQNLLRAAEYKDRSDGGRHKNVQEIHSQVQTIKKALTPVDSTVETFTASQLSTLQTKYGKVTADIQDTREKVKVIEVQDSFSSKFMASCRELVNNFKSLFSSNKASPVAIPASAGPGIGFFPKVFDEENTYHERAVKANIPLTLSEKDLTSLVKTPYLKSKEDQESYKTYSYYLLRAKISTLKKTFETMDAKSPKGQLKSMEEEISGIFAIVEDQYKKNIKSSMRFAKLLPKLQSEFAELRADIMLFVDRGERLTGPERNFRDTVQNLKIDSCYTIHDSKELSKALSKLVTSNTANDEAHAYYILRKLLENIDTVAKDISKLENELASSGKSISDMDTIYDSSSQLNFKINQLQSLLKQFGKLLTDVKRKFNGRISQIGLMLQQFDREFQNFNNQSLPKAKEVQAFFQELIDKFEKNEDRVVDNYEKLIKTSPERAAEEAERILLSHPGLKNTLETAREAALSPAPVIEQKQPTVKAPSENIPNDPGKPDTTEQAPAKRERFMLSDTEAFELLLKKDQALADEKSPEKKEVSRVSSHAALQETLKDILGHLDKMHCADLIPFNPSAEAMRTRYRDGQKFVVSPKAFVYLDTAEAAKAVHEDLSQFDQTCIDELVKLNNSSHFILVAVKLAATHLPTFLNGLKDETVLWIAKNMMTTLFPKGMPRSQGEETLIARIHENVEKRKEVLHKSATRRDVTALVAEAISNMSNTDESTIVTACGGLLQIDEDKAEVVIMPGVGAHRIKTWLDDVLLWPQSGVTNPIMLEFSEQLTNAIGKAGEFPSPEAKAEYSAESEDLAELNKRIRSDLTTLFSDSEEGKKSLLEAAKLIYSSDAVDQAHRKSWKEALQTLGFTEETFTKYRYGSSSTAILEFINSSLKMLARRGELFRGILRSKQALFTGHQTSSLGQSPELEYKGNPPQLCFSESKHQSALSKILDTDMDKVKKRPVTLLPEIKEIKGELEGQQIQVQMQVENIPDSVLADHESKIIQRNEQIHELAKDVQLVLELFERCQALVRSQGEGTSGYDMVFLSVGQDEKDIISLAKQASQMQEHKSYPVLIRQGDKIHVYGNSTKARQWDGDSLYLASVDTDKLSTDTLKSHQAKRTPLLNKHNDQYSLLKFNGQSWEVTPLKTRDELEALEFPEGNKVKYLDSCSLTLSAELRKRGANKNWRLTEVGTYSGSAQLMQQLVFPGLGKGPELIEGQNIDSKVYQQITQVAGHRASCIEMISTGIESAKGLAAAGADDLEAAELAKYSGEELQEMADQAQNIASGIGKKIETVKKTGEVVLAVAQLTF